MRLIHKNSTVVAFLMFLNLGMLAQVQNKSWKQITESNSEKWFSSEEAADIAENVLLYQRNIGGWPKNIQMQLPISDTEKQKLLVLKADPIDSTIDNGATCQEMLFLSKMYKKNPP